MDNNTRIEYFKQKLDAVNDWPSLYMFKFIVPQGKENEVRALFPKNEVTEKPSSKGKYTSLTIKAMMPGSDEIIEIYQKANQVEGLIAL
jgi:putative lipoic acid-binding regulatory protein